jgi:penicillin amidase
MSSFKLFFACCVALITTNQTLFAAPDESFGTIELVRDEYGIPHIFSDTDAGAFYGLGYATAQDRAFHMYFSLRTIQGRLAEVLGDVKKVSRDETALEHDIMMRSVGFYRKAQEVANNLDQESQALLQAYSDGVNDYIKQHKDDLLYLFDKYGIEPEPWTPGGSIAVWWGVARFFAKDGLRDLFSYNQLQNPRDPQMQGNRVVDDSAAVVQREDVSGEWIEEVNTFMREHGFIEEQANNDPDAPKFSHAWVVGKDKTTDGSAVLCSDPQTPVRNPSMFMEYHYQGKTFNARGIGVPGSPVILIGWTENVAWGLTALGADQADQFRLQTDADHPNQYFHDGEWKDMKVWDETIKIKDKDDYILPLKETHYGPVVTHVSLNPKPGQEVALKRIPTCETDRETIQGFINMIRAKNTKSFIDAAEGWRFPSANMVVGDKHGDIGFTLIAAIPVRSSKDEQHGNAAHDGTDSSYDWQTIMPHHLMPHVINPKRGYLSSGNHRAIESFYPASMGVSTGAGGESDRSWRLKQRLSAQDKFTPEDVLDIHYDSTNAAKYGILKLAYHARDVQLAYLSDDALYALDYLEEWYKSGAVSETKNKGTELANLMPLMFRIMQTPLAEFYGGSYSGLCLFLKNLYKHMDEDPFLELDPMEIQFADNTLAAAWNAALNQYGDDPDQWHEKMKEQIKQRTLGYFETLDGFGSLDKAQDIHFPLLRNVDGGTILSQAALSYSQWVPMGDVDSAKSILPIGQSENPKSPYHHSNVEDWAKGETHPAPISKDAVMKIKKSVVVLSK